MQTLGENETFDADYVSTGKLPSSDLIQQLIHDAHERYKPNTDGTNSRVYPALERVSSDLFGICLVGASGRVHSVGDTEHEFTIMSVSKPFIFALVCQTVGSKKARELLGANSTGMAFNSAGAIERSPDGRTNPMVNSGAIMTTSLVPGATVDEKWKFIHTGLSKFAGRELTLNDEVYQSATETNYQNRGIANILHGRKLMYSDPLEATDLYTRQCSLNINTKDLALMGATLANGGLNPITGERVVSLSVCHYTLAIMITAGLYENSGDWLYNTGLPGKSGIGGGIVTVAPGKGGLGTFAPPLDSAGNSVKGQLVTQYLSRRLGLDLFISSPNT